MAINMNIGGTEKALLNMISAMPLDKFDITLLLLEKYGGFLDMIPSRVNVIYLKDYQKIDPLVKSPLHQTIIHALTKGRVLLSIRFLYYYIRWKIIKDQIPYLKYLTKQLPCIHGEYDIAVAYAGPMDLISYFVIENIKAKRKAQWIHFDISKIGINERLVAKLYRQFDRVFVVSDEGKEQFVSAFPYLKDKAEVFLNVISEEVILKLAREGYGYEDNYNGLRLLTVGRLSKEKGQDLAIRVMARLKQDDYDVRWYCIGEGNARKEFQDQINEKGLKQDFILLGAQTNPYPFMAQCDVYIQPSRYEGFCITLSEAKCFHKPILSTDFTGANEQLINNVTGKIVHFDEGDMYEAIKLLLENSSLKATFRRNLQRETVDTIKELDKLYKLIG